LGLNKKSKVAHQYSISKTLEISLVQCKESGLCKHQTLEEKLWGFSYFFPSTETFHGLNQFLGRHLTFQSG
jgi:hypothetical protein